MESELTGKIIYFRLADGSISRALEGYVFLDTPYFQGWSKVLCLKNPIVDVLIGNVENATIEEMVLNKPISDHEIHDGGIQNKFLEGSKILGTQNRPIP